MFAMESETTIIIDKLIKLERDVELIKEAIVSEGELTDWAKTELERARQRKNKIPHDMVIKRALER